MIGTVTLWQQIGVSNALGLCFSNPIYFSLLQQQLRRPDLADEKALRLLQAGGILSQKVAEALDKNRRDPEIQKVTNIFMARLKRLVADPKHKRYAELKISDAPSEDRILLRYMENAGWRVTDDFGTLSIVTAAEIPAIAQGETENIFQPHLVITGAMQAVGEPITNGGLMLNGVGTNNGSIPSTEGAIILSRGAPARREAPLMSYRLLRETVFQYLARSRFKAAADLILSITDEFVLTRLILDFYESRLEKVETALAFGMTFAEMPAGSVAQIVILLSRQLKPDQRAKLERWLVWGLSAIRPEEVFVEPGREVPLPKLSIVLGTLIEHPKSRALATRLLRIVLDEHHPDYELFRQALRHLNFHYDAFLEPYAIMAGGFRKIFDEELAVAKKSKTKRRTGGATTSIFVPPPDSLATRQEMVAQFQQKLAEAEEESKEFMELATQILLTLPAADIWQVVEVDYLPNVARKDGKTPAQRLALLLENQSPEVAADFFPAWVRSISNEVTLSDAGHALVALWRRGERGEALVAHAIAEALKNRDATVAMQRLMSQIGTGDLLDGLVEIYEALTNMEHPHPSSLAGELNPLEMFFATGVLKPEDLVGSFREQAIIHAFGILKYGRVGMEQETYTYDHGVDQQGAWATTEPTGELRPNTGEPLPQAIAAKCDEWAIGALVKLRAGWKPVTDYLLSALPTAADLHERIQQREKEGIPLGLDILTPDEKRFFDALEEIGHEALALYYQNLEAVIPLNSTTSRLNFAGMVHANQMDVSENPIAGMYHGAIAYGLIGVPLGIFKLSEMIFSQKPQIDFEKIVKIFPFSLHSIRRYVALRLLALAPFFKTSNDFGNIRALDDIKEALGENALGLLSSNFLWRCARKPFMIPRLRHLVNQNHATLIDMEVGAEELIPVLIHLAFSLGTPASHQALVNFYYEQRGQEWFKPAHEDLLIEALVRLESQQDWRGPFALNLYCKYYLRDREENRNPKTAERAFHGIINVLVLHPKDGDSHRVEAVNVLKLLWKDFFGILPLHKYQDKSPLPRTHDLSNICQQIAAIDPAFAEELRRAYK